MGFIELLYFYMLIIELFVSLVPVIICLVINNHILCADHIVAPFFAIILPFLHFSYV